MKVEFKSFEDLVANMVKGGCKENEAESIAKSMFGYDVEKIEKDNEGKMNFVEFSKSLDQAVKDEKITESEAATAQTAFGIGDRRSVAAILEKIKPATEQA